MNPLDEALDAAVEPGPVELERKGGTATIDTTDVGPIGVRVTRVRVERTQPWGIAETARDLPERLRSLPERVEPVEVDPGLGGAVLRTRPEELRGDGYYEVEVTGNSAEVRRVRVEDGQREAGDFALTREQLGRLLDELEG